MTDPRLPETAHAAAFPTLTPVQRDRIAQTCAPISALMATVNRALAPKTAQVTTIQKALQPLTGALAVIGEAQELERQVWVATPRDRRPEARRLFQSLQSLPVAKVKATLMARLRHALQRTQSRERGSSSTTRTPRTTTSRRTQTSATPAADPSPSSPASLSVNALGRLRTETPPRWCKRALIGCAR